MPARQTSTESSIDERPATRSQGPADDTTDKKRTAVQAGVNKNDPIPEKRSKSEGSETSTTERAKDGRRQGHQPHESIDEILKDEDYELVSERTNKYGNSTLIFLDKNSGYHATYPNVSHEHYKPGSRDVVKDDSRKSYSRRDDDDVKHGHVQGAVLHPETDKRLKENQDGKPYQAEAGKQSHKDTPSKTEAKDDSKDAKYEANRKDDSVQHGHTQGAVLHPETDMRLKENRDKKERSYDTKHPEANKQSTKNGTGYENKDHSYETISQDDRYELVEEHENKNGASTLVYRNKDTDYHIVFPNVKKSDDDKSTTKDSKDDKYEANRKDDNVQHGHTQGAVLHPESDKRLKENRDDGESNDDKQAKYEANRKDDSVKHGHTQGAVLHPETDMRLKENRDKAEEGKDSKTTTKDSKDDGVKHGHTQGAVLHPETDKRLKENQDGKPYQAEAGKQSHKNE